MAPKSIAVLILWIIAVALFAFVGFDIVSSTKYNLVAVGLSCAWAGMIIDHFVA